MAHQCHACGESIEYDFSEYFGVQEDLHLSCFIERINLIPSSHDSKDEADRKRRFWKKCTTRVLRKMNKMYEGFMKIDLDTVNQDLEALLAEPHVVDDFCEKEKEVLQHLEHKKQSTVENHQKEIKEIYEKFKKIKQTPDIRVDAFRPATRLSLAGWHRLFHAGQSGVHHQ